LIKEDEAKLDTFKDNKEEAMKYICKEMGINVENLKLQVGCYCNIIMKQFNHVTKYIGEQMKEYFDTLKERNKEIVEQGFIISKLINVQIE
jgi:transcriptional regulator of met regulon